MPYLCSVLTHKQDQRPVLDKRLEDNELALRTAYENGLEFIDNIQRTCEKRNVDRKKFENHCDEEVEELLRIKSQAFNAQFDNIAERFGEIRLIADDQKKLPEELTRQKRRIEQLMANKDDCIAKLRSEYSRLDDDYAATILKQRNDMHFLYVRMNEHLEAMRSSFKHYLGLLQDTIDAERETLNLTVRRKWSELHDKVDANLDMKHRVEQEKRAFYDAQLERVRLEHAEITRAARIQLERDEQQVHLDLQQLRSHAALNSEKFDYNYQILAKKGDENVTVRNQQKRKLAQMRDQAVLLRKEIAEVRENFTVSSAKCKQEVIRFHSSFMELETRADRYARINDKKFDNVWKMNEEEANGLLQRVLAIDKVLYEQQLGLPWPQPALAPMNRKDLPSYKEAIQALYHPHDESDDSHDSLMSTESPVHHATTIPSQKGNFQEQMLADTRVLRIILRQIAEESDFLVEAKLQALLRPYLSGEKMNIVEVDHIFQALGIQSMRNVSTLIEHFVPYAWCTVCSMPAQEPDTLSSISTAKPEAHKPSMIRKTVANLAKETLNVANANAANEFLDADLVSYIQDFERANQVEAFTRQSFYPTAAMFDNLNLPGKDDPNAPHTPCEHHRFVIEPGCVLKVFRAYAQTCLNANARTVIGGIGASTHSTTMSDRLMCVRSSVSRLMRADDVEAFWRRFREVFTPESRRLWDSLEHGLKEYLRVLQRRDQLNTECEYLRRQNAELRHMLQPYLEMRQGKKA